MVFSFSIFFVRPCSDGVKMKETQSPALVCDRAAAGSDPVQTGLPPIRGRSENTFRVLTYNASATSSTDPEKRVRAPSAPGVFLCTKSKKHLDQSGYGVCFSMTMGFLGVQRWWIKHFGNVGVQFASCSAANRSCQKLTRHTSCTRVQGDTRERYRDRPTASPSYQW